MFALSVAGKPIYSRYGNEDELVTLFGVMQALVSFIKDDDDSLRCLIAGDENRCDGEIMPPSFCQASVARLMGAVGGPRQVICGEFNSMADIFPYPITSIGKHKYVFVCREPLILVAVGQTRESTRQLALSLNYAYNQILSVLTLATLSRILNDKPNFDLRRLLAGEWGF